MINKLTFLILYIFFLLPFQLIAGESDYIFRHLTLEDGLSNSNVNCIVQDSNGFIWIGTENGLNKYDGYKFTHYFSEINKENSLISNEIHTLMIDSHGELWVGSFQGLFKYNGLADNFEHIHYEDFDALRVNIPVYDLLEDSDSSLWIATGEEVYLNITETPKMQWCLTIPKTINIQ